MQRRMKVLEHRKVRANFLRYFRRNWEPPGYGGQFKRGVKSAENAEKTSKTRLKLELEILLLCDKICSKNLLKQIFGGWVKIFDHFMIKIDLLLLFYINNKRGSIYDQNGHFLIISDQKWSILIRFDQKWLKMIENDHFKITFMVTLVILYKITRDDHILIKNMIKFDQNDQKWSFLA